jgi:hypothetical protein
MVTAGDGMLALMRRFDSQRSIWCFALVLCACGDRPADPVAAPAVSPVPAPVPDLAPAPDAPAPPRAATETNPNPRTPVKPPDPPPDKPHTASSARTQASIETEKLNRVHVEPSSVPAEPIAAQPAAAPAPASEPAPPPPAAKPAGGRVTVPNTARLHVEIPAGLQRWLDADTRMQPWLNKVIPVIDRCYGNVLADNAGASGTITFRVTMHKDARPDPDIQSLPGQLSGVVTCATGQLMRTRMPLFTGTEGESHTVRVRFGE